MRIGYLEELTWLRPLPAAITEVESVLRHVRAFKLPNDFLLLGLHQRSLDGLCYKWIQNRQQIASRKILECHPNSLSVREPLSLIQGKVLSKTELFTMDNRCHGIPTNGLLMNKTHRECFFNRSGGYGLCDMTLSENHKIYMRKSSVTFPRNDSFGVLTASDHLNPEISKELRENVKHIFSLGDIDPELDWARASRNVLLLKEMWALALSDYFVSQPFSSCDSIIAHWRHGIFNKPLDSSFPPNCWELYHP